MNRASRWQLLLTVLTVSVFLLLPKSSLAGDVYFETEVKLKSPKSDSKRSQEGGLEHVLFRLWLPDGVKSIRGVTFNPFYTKAVTQQHWQAANRQWGCGILATNLFGVKPDEFPVVVDAALSALAKQSGHAELHQCKLCLVGMSAGAGMCTRIAEHMPERTIAMGPVCLEVGPRDEASMSIPTITVFGERDGRQYDTLMAKLPEIRDQGGRFAIAVQWRRKHEFGQANNLLLPLFDAAIRLRLGEPGELLKSIDESSGWLGDVSAWRDGEAIVSPNSDFQGDKARACWFPDATTARTWQSFVTHDPQLRLKSPSGLGDEQPLVLYKTGDVVTVQVAGEPKSAGTIEVYSGVVKLGELEDGKLVVKLSKPGIYPVFLQARSENGKVLRSRPHTLIVN